MSTIKTFEIQHGIWIDNQWLQIAGLGSRVQVSVKMGEIRIVSAPDSKSEQLISSDIGRRVLSSLGKNAKAGKLQNVAEQHDKYLYGKK
jgi:hypothetical protein